MKLWIAFQHTPGFSCQSCGERSEEVGTFRIGPQDDEQERPLVLSLCDMCCAIIGAQLTSRVEGIDTEVLEEKELPERGSA
jgi:hypothetical protein